MSALTADPSSRSTAILCPHCDHPIDANQMAGGDVECRLCERTFRLVTFSPPERRGARAEQAGLTPDAKAVCGNHPRNVAAHGCTRCGMFICNLCAIEADGMTLCPRCYERLTAEGELSSTRMKFRDMGGLASTAAVAGILMWFFCVIAGPMAIGYGIKALRQRKEVGDMHSPLRIWIAIIIGTLETIAGIAMIAFMIIGFSK
jgi:uncharacterized paraquat-inducible protein A